jgi:phosphoserine phosphatase
MSVLCLIANPAEPALDSKIVQAIQHETGGEINWLHQRIACEIISPQEAGSAAIARQALSGRPVDVALIPHTNRRKKILVADMDSTMIDQECIDEIADAVGIKAEVAAITARAMNGELDFAEALRTRVALVKGLDRKIIEEIRRERITLAAGGRALIQTMKAYGAYCSLVSGGFTFFANYYAERIGFDEAIANTLVFDGDTLAGTVADPIVDKTTKLTRLLTLAEERSVPSARPWP